MICRYANVTPTSPMVGNANRNANGCCQTLQAVKHTLRTLSRAHMTEGIWSRRRDCGTSLTLRRTELDEERFHWGDSTVPFRLWDTNYPHTVGSISAGTCLTYRYRQHFPPLELMRRNPRAHTPPNAEDQNYFSCKDDFQELSGATLSISTTSLISQFQDNIPLPTSINCHQCLLPNMLWVKVPH